MSKRILLACYEVPGFGGASTANYSCFQKLREEGVDAYLLNIIGEGEKGYFQYLFDDRLGNPSRLEGVYNCFLEGLRPNPGLGSLIARINPDLVVASGYIAALLIKRTCPARKLIFFTSGCNLAEIYIGSGLARDAVALCKLANEGRGSLPTAGVEWEAIERSELVVTHSKMIRTLYRFFYPSMACKIATEVVWKAEWIYDEALNYSVFRKPFADRDIDLVAIASSWNRPEKNFELLRELASRLEGYRFHLVGGIPEQISTLYHHGFMKGREALFRLLGRTKSVLCPSLIDAAPGVLFEAAAMGCNIVASRNCGNWRACHPDLLVEPFGLNGFIERISLAVSKEYSHNVDYFRQTGSFRKFVDILSVF